MHQHWHGGRSVKNNECHNAYQHIRREEWRALLGDKTESNNPLPKKFKIPKNWRPNREQLDEKTNTYVDMVLSKLHNLTLWRLAAIGNLRKKTPKRTWLCAGISPLLFGLWTWSKRQKTRQVF